MMFVDIVDAARPRTAARRRRLHVPRRRAERAQRVPAGEGTRADAAVHVQPERHAAEGADVVLAVRRRGVALRLGEHLRRDAGRRARRRRCAGPSDRINFNGRRRSRAEQVAHAARDRSSRTTTISGTSASATSICRARAFARTSSDSMLRLSESGPLAPAWFGESRLQVRWHDRGSSSVARSCRPSACSTPSPSGGAQQAGGRRSTELEWATNVDWARGRHAVRVGALVEGGRFRSDNRTNYLGTYTFASLADYEAGRPATYTRRDRRSARRVLALAGRALRPGRLARAQEPDAERRRAPGAPDAPRRPMEPRAARRAHVVAVQERQDHRPRRRRDLLRLARSGDVYEQTLRVDGVRQQDLVIRNPGYPESVRRRRRSARSCRRASTCSPTIS